MNKRAGMFSLISTIAVLMLSTSTNAATMDEEIDYLLHAVGTSGCTFIRNGKRYAAPDARMHLQTKRKRGKRYYSSADEFIENLASKSSMSGKPYFIQCADGVQQPSAAWFAALLAKYREKRGRTELT